MWRNKGLQSTTYTTINGRVEIRRRVYWSRDGGSAVPVDSFLGIEHDRYSPSMREMLVG